MNNQSLERLAANLEIWLAGLLLFYFLGPSLPPLITKVLNAGSYGITALLIVWRWKRCLYIATRDIPLILLFGMVATSVFWSALPQITSITSKATLRAMLLGVYLAARYDIKEQMRLFSWVFGIAALVSLIISLGNTGAWTGIFPYKNYLAIYMILAAMLFLLTALKNPRKHWIAWAGLALAATLVFLSQGKGGYVIFVISLYLLPLYIFVKQQYKLRVILLIMALLASGIVILLVTINLETIVVDILGKNLEFNGRVPIWTLCIEQALKRPWLGYGISGFWGSHESMVIFLTTWAGNSDNFERFNSHNGYIELLLQLGFVGLFLYIINLLCTFTRIIHIWLSTGSIESFWLLQSIIIMLLFNFTDNGGVLSKNTLWILYISISLSSIVWSKRIKRKRSALTYNPELLTNKELVK